MPSLTDAFKSHPLNLNHHKSLFPDFNSLHELPDSYAWTQNHDYDLSPDHSSFITPSPPSETVPIIDLNDPNALKLIGHACQTWGMFQVTNHGIPERIVGDMESACRALFSLPAQQKLRAARSADGVSGYGIHRISSFFEKLLWSEGFTIAGSPLEHFRQLWPQDYTKYCEIVKEYEEEMKRLAARLMWLILGSLDVSKEDVKWAGPKGEFEAASAALQLNSYPICPDPSRAMGLGEHTDSTLFSIVHQSNTSGLQVLREGTGWITVAPVSGGLVVNIGDLFHILSNGLYLNVYHRVVVNRTQYRFSVAYLYGPPERVEISPLSKLVGPNKPPLYPPITWTEYLGTKAKLNTQTLPTLRRSCFSDSVHVN